MDTNPLSEDTSRRILVLRYPLIFAVIVVHARSYQTGMTDFPYQIESGWGFAIQWLFSEIFCRLAVPLFFIHAGLLFFAGSKSVASKWRSRLKTLLWPYLLWNALILIFQFIPQKIPGIDPENFKYAVQFDSLSLVQIADLFLGFDQSIANGPLWFLRDLMFLCLLAPLYIRAIDLSRGLFLLLPLFVWLGGFGPHFTGFPLSAESALFFGLGLAFASPRVTSPKVASLLTLSRPALLLLFSAYLLLAAYEISQQLQGNNPYIAHKLAFFPGLIIVWHFAGQQASPQRVLQTAAALAPAAFFTYLSHGAILQGVKEVSYLLLQPESPAKLLIAYFLAATLTAIILLAVYKLLARHAPRAIHSLTGRPPQQNR